MNPSRWRCARLPVILLVVLTGLATAAFGQAAGPSHSPSDIERIEQLERAVKELQAEIAALKSASPTDARIAELERKIEVLAGEIEAMRIGEAAEAKGSDYGLGPAASKIYRTERGLSIGGYGEMLYSHFGSPQPARADLERAVLYVGYKFNDRWLLNMEVEHEHAGEEVDVEFAYLDYLWRPEANFRAGLLLVPMGFLNELHEPTVYLGARRPDVEQLIIPTTWRAHGFGLFGQAGPWSYRTYLIAGLNARGFTAESLREGQQEGKEEKAKDLGWVGRLDYAGLPGLLLGGSAYAGGSGQDLTGGDGRRISLATRLYEGHLEWRWRALTFRALGVEARLGDSGDIARLDAALGLTGDQSIGERLRGYYVQLGYDLLAGRGGQKALTPYARYESYDTQSRVPAGFRRNPANQVDSLTLGIAFKPIDQIVFKVDHQSYHNAAGTGVDQVNVLLGYIF